jgi:carbamate kinase
MIKSSIDHGRASYQQPSMLPKIRAALRFTTSGPGRKTLITSLDKLVEGLKGQTGTWIVP